MVLSPGRVLSAAALVPLSCAGPVHKRVEGRN